MAALLFLVYPSAWDVPLWNTMIATSVATALTLAGALLFLRFARGGGPMPGTLWGVACAMFAACCFIEQPACAAAAFPLLAVAAGGSERPARIPRVLVAWAGALAPCVLYLALYYASAGREARGGAASFVNLAELAAKVRLLPPSTADVMLLRGFARGSLEQGARVLLAPGAFNLVALGALAAGAVALARTLARPSALDPPAATLPRPHRPLRLLFETRRQQRFHFRKRARRRHTPPPPDGWIDRERGEEVGRVGQAQGFQAN